MLYQLGTALALSLLQYYHWENFVKGKSEKLVL